MKRIIACTPFALAIFQAHAQSSVTLYGIISVGVQAVSNAGGKPLYGTVVASQPSRFGFRIKEDIGGGNAIVSTLENGFNNLNGAATQGGRLFGRQAWVGITNPRYGTLTIGRQYDAFWDYFTATSTLVGNIGLFDHPGDTDNIIGSWRYSNSVKYVTPTYRGFNAEILYAFSNTPNGFGFNRAISVGAGYRAHGLQIAAAYVQLDQPGADNPAGAVSDDYGGAPFQFFRSSPLDPAVGVRRQRNYGLGGYYDFRNDLRVSALIDQSRIDYLDGVHFTLTNFDAAFTYMFTSTADVTAGYVYSLGRYGGTAGKTMHWNSLSVSAGYYLSKRTDVRIVDLYQRSSGDRAPTGFYGQPPSSGHQQNVVMLALRHRF